MGWATKDGPWVSASSVLKVECSQCGTVEVTKYPCNDREAEAKIRAHAAKHGGVRR